MYAVEVNKGLGSTKINGKSIGGNTIFGIGENAISVNGGIGTVNVNFKE